MNILTPNFYAYMSPAFGTNSRIYENPIQDVQAGTTNIYTTTYLLRGDLDFKKVVDYAKEKSKNKSQINVACLAGSDGSEAYSYGLCFLNQFSQGELKKLRPIISLDRDAEITKAGQSGKINLTKGDIKYAKELSKGKDYFVSPDKCIDIKNNRMGVGALNNSYKPISELKNLVQFEQGNLLDYLKNYKSDEDTLSIINCRNVMPYLHPIDISDIAYYADKNLKKDDLFVIGSYDKDNTEIEKYLDFYNFEKIMPNVYRRY